MPNCGQRSERSNDNIPIIRSNKHDKLKLIGPDIIVELLTSAVIHHIPSRSYSGLKKILSVSDFRPTLSKHVLPKFILWISKKKS